MFYYAEGSIGISLSDGSVAIFYPCSLRDHSATINLIKWWMAKAYGLPMRPTTKRLATGTDQMHVVADFVTTYPMPQLHFRPNVLEHPDLLVKILMRNAPAELSACGEPQQQLTRFKARDLASTSTQRADSVSPSPAGSNAAKPHSGGPKGELHQQQSSSPSTVKPSSCSCCAAESSRDGKSQQQPGSCDTGDPASTTSQHTSAVSPSPSASNAAKPHGGFLSCVAQPITWASGQALKVAEALHQQLTQREPVYIEPERPRHSAAKHSWSSQRTGGG
ncbi:hypothetical protein GPECTOR_9g716 [Gonium pectorale]|uniref:Uncharacterized protein n=1 Tax=Gonium pectorale TaxID=33097 RepID=A0A150GTJ0_GONPE|nr:hypothetical protein GPECTOR_9g716 [Gonium pectorale]|eukprot:KXZ52670.1 hypothetical protein GPECTOR_9g716 [Gonium pectorale]